MSLYAGGSEVYSHEYSVGPLSRAEIDLKSLAANAEIGSISYSSSSLVFRVSYKNEAGGIAELKALDTLAGNQGLFFSDFTSFVAWKGAALANFGFSDVRVTLNALGGSEAGMGASLLATHSETIGPRSKVIGTSASWFPELDLNQVESIVAVSDAGSSLCGLTISGDADVSRLLFTPAVPVVGFDEQISEWNLTVSVDLDGRFTVTADLLLGREDDSFTAQIATKQIGGATEVHNVTFQGPFDSATATGTLQDEVFTITVGGAQEIITLNGSFTVNGSSSITTQGSFTSSSQYGTYSGTFSGTGTPKP